MYSTGQGNQNHQRYGEAVSDQLLCIPFHRLNKNLIHPLGEHMAI